MIFDNRELTDKSHPCKMFLETKIVFINIIPIRKQKLLCFLSLVILITEIVCTQLTFF